MGDDKSSPCDNLIFKKFFILFLVLSSIFSQVFAQKISLAQYPDEVVKGEKFAVKLDIYTEPEDKIFIIASIDGEVSLHEFLLLEDSIFNVELVKLNQFFIPKNHFPNGFFAQKTFIFADTFVHSSALRSYALVMSARTIGEIKIKFLPVKLYSDSLIYDAVGVGKGQLTIKVKSSVEKTAGLCAKFEKEGFIKFNMNEKFTAKNGFTLSFWIKTTLMKGKMITFKSGIDKSFMIVGLKSGNIFFSINNSIGKYEVVLPKFVSDGKWHNIIIGQSDNFLRFYIDGERIDEVLIPNLSQFEINRPSVRVENVLIDEIVLLKGGGAGIVERLSRYFVKADTEVIFLLKFENETVNISGNVSGVESSGVKFVPSSAPICSPEVKISAQLKDNNIIINWEVEDPSFIDRFVVERKVRDELFQPVYQIFPSEQKRYTFVDATAENNAVYYYRVKRVNRNGSIEFSDEVKIGMGLKRDFEIIGNFPNPFNSETRIIYNLFNDTYVKLTVYDIVGREIAILVDGFQSAGRHEISFNLGNVKSNEITSGIYFYKLQTQRGYEIRKMIVIK
ncbi:LamG-like jellyroll fold domain-containing protein [Candidatus Kryptobacter tengchongensis]|uniref:Por secretion system C-terminal sorting domain-containing protein n=1 Tax=Kryptobacter tengchongensis TaxID=1643429 RepID=A0A916LJG3_KRYT1|nr:LamG-like jellyroll fold domain-containing protein [Candidatus Kryptobacter tengchongensis]CUT01577.1 Por secretion system C-terminal sorting domain-containing protein [Candidatus Kryptobacter tengchongensis]